MTDEPLQASNESTPTLARPGIMVMDVDSTLIDQEVIDELGVAAGVGGQIAAVAARARRPFVASHSNSRAVCGHLRNLTDDQFRCIRDAGGVVGLNYCTLSAAGSTRWWTVWCKMRISTMRWRTDWRSLTVG